MTYNRQNPSPRYNNLIQQYRTLHTEGEKFLGLPAAQTFPGQSLLPQAERIKALIEKTGAKTILDYGSGKGLQYQPLKLQGPQGKAWNSVQEYWQVQTITCYDPCYQPFSALPTGQFDGVISTDVLEHCPEEDIDWILQEIFSYATRFVFANVACYPAKKRLPTGENAHITVYPKPWWEEKILITAERFPHLTWEFWIQSVTVNAKGEKSITEERIDS